MMSYLVHNALCPGVCLPSSKICKDCECKNFEGCARILKEKILALYLHEEASTRDLESCVMSALRDLGVPVNTQGYSMLQTALTLLVQDATLINSVGKRLYVEVANRHASTPNRVERNIRHAIESACSRCKLDVQQQWYGNTIHWDKAKPTNTEFLAIVSEQIRYNLKNGVQ